MSSAGLRRYVLIQALNEVSDANLVAGRCHIAAQNEIALDLESVVGGGVG